MQNKRQDFSKTKKTRRAIPRGALVLGDRNGACLYVTPKQRSRHMMVVGASGTGKSTFLENCLRQDIRAGRGCALIDPHGDVYRRILGYCCYLRAIGLRVPDVALFDPASPWVTPMNPFKPGPGDISTQVDRRVAATLRAWGQANGDETPRLEKWLKVLFTVLIEHGLTILEAAYLVDQDSAQIRAHLGQHLADPLIAAKLAQLSAYKPADFANQIESTESRLLRFLCSGALKRTMGVGTNALDYTAMMDRGDVLLMDLSVSDHFSEADQRLVGTMTFGGMFETAMRRRTGSRPFYLYIDESELFVIPELGRAFEQCRKRGLHLTVLFQHLAQFKAEDFRVYKALTNNAGTKIVFAVRDREDATELADNLCVGLAEPKVKYVRTRLNHRLEDTRDKSVTRGEGVGESHGKTSGKSLSRGKTTGRSEGESQNQSRSKEESLSTTHSRSENESHVWSLTETETTGEQRSFGWGDAQTTTHGWTRGRQYGSTDSSGESSPVHGEGGATFSSHASTQATTEGETHSEASTASHQESTGTSLTHARGHGSSEILGTQQGTSTGRTHTHGLTSGVSRSSESTWAETNTDAQSESMTAETSTNTSYSVTVAPTTRHIPFLEEDPEFWTLEESRWRAAERIMRHSIGHCGVSIDGADLLPISVPLPPRFFIRAKQMEKITNQFYESHSLLREQADELTRRRQEQFLRTARQNGRGGPSRANGRKASAAGTSSKDGATPTDPFDDDDPFGKE